MAVRSEKYSSTDTETDGPIAPPPMMPNSTVAKSSVSLTWYGGSIKPMMSSVLFDTAQNRIRVILQLIAFPYLLHPK